MTKPPSPNIRLTITVSPEVRYKVILIASTFSSRAAATTNCSTEAEKESYGW